MKLFQTNIVIVNCCRKMFGIDLPSVALFRRKEKFIQRLNHCVNTLIKRAISMKLRRLCCVFFFRLCLCILFFYMLLLPINFGE